MANLLHVKQERDLPGVPPATRKLNQFPALISHAGKPWLITLNMDNTMGKAKLPNELQALAMKVRNNIYSIMSAGALGEL